MIEKIKLSFKKIENSNRNLKALSLFSGCGGDTLGMELSNVNVVGFIENDKDAIKSHKLNFPNSELIGSEVNGDITKITANMLVKYKDIDIIFAGFPCQPFSNAGKKDIDDPRSKLFWEFLRIVEIIKPKWIIGENVKGILSRKTNNNVYIKDLIINEFDILGYNMVVKLLNMTDYNICQKRERVFFIGCIKSSNIIFNFPNPVSNTEKISLLPILENDMSCSIKYSFDDNIKCIITEDNMTCDNNVHPYLNLMVSKNLLSYSKRISPHHCEIIDIESPSKTIICTYNRQPRLFVPLKNNLGTYLRAFNIDELKQIQSFPKTYKLYGNLTSQIKQIGNAVPPKIINILIDEIISQDASLSNKKI